MIDQSCGILEVCRNCRILEVLSLTITEIGISPFFRSKQILFTPKNLWDIIFIQMMSAWMWRNKCNWEYFSCRAEHLTQAVTTYLIIFLYLLAFKNKQQLEAYLIDRFPVCKWILWNTIFYFHRKMNLPPSTSWAWLMHGLKLVVFIIYMSNLYIQYV